MKQLPSSLTPRHHGRAAARLGWRCLLAVLMPAFVLALVWESTRYGYAELSESWEMALAHFLKLRWQAGTDYVFTYGPLGYFGTALFDPGLFWPRYAWEGIVSLALAGLLLRAFARLADPISRTAFCLVVLTVELHPLDVRVPVLILLGVLFLSERSRLGIVAPVCWVLVAAACLVKFTLLLFALGLAVILVMSLTQRGRWRLALLHLAGWGGCLAGGWLALGQSPANVGAYVRGSWELTRAYGSAMSLPEAPTRQLVLAGCLVAGLVACLVLAGPRAPRAQQAFAACLWFLAAQWKLGFSRPDGHQAVFFASAALVPFLLFAHAQAPGPGATRAGVCLLFAVVGISELPFCVPARERPDYNVLDTPAFGTRELGRLVQRIARYRAQLAYAITPGRVYEERLAARAAILRQPGPLPRLRERVGTDSVDCLSWGQSLVLSRRMKWRPRPVFQSYLTYTPWLLEANAAFYRSDRAPRYVAILTGAIDLRQPTMEDSLALLEILRRYRPILSEEQPGGPAALLLGRAQGPPVSATATILLTRAVRLGEVLPLPAPDGRLWTLSARFRPTAWGRLRTLLYQAPEVWMTTKLAPEGNQARTRLLPSTDGAEFLIDPFVVRPEDFRAVYGQAPALHPRAISLTVGERGCYQDEVEVVLRSYASPRIVPAGRDSP